MSFGPEYKERLSICNVTATTLLPLPTSQRGEPAGSTRVRHVIVLAPGQFLLPGCCVMGLGQAVCDPGPWHPSTDATFSMLIEDIQGGVNFPWLKISVIA